MVGGKQGESGKRKNEIVSFLYYYFYQSSFTESVVEVGEYNYFTNRDGYCIKYKRVIWLALIFHLLSQAKDVNLKEHRRLEREWMNALKDNKKVSVTVKIKYDSNSLRLSKFQVRYKIDRKTRIEIIRNINKR